MSKHSIDSSGEVFALPHIGQRIVKTTVAVFICLMFYSLRGYRGQGMPTEAAITAIICMQPYVRDTGKYALDRFVGTLIGVFWGLLLLLLLNDFPALGARLLLLYAMMAAGVLLSLYSAVLVRRPEASGLASIVFLCIVIAFPDIEVPLVQAGHRILDVFVGTTVATLVNIVRLPRRAKRRDLVFFMRTADLVPDRFSHLAPAAAFRLNALFDAGANICLMSEHAPAFFALQMKGTKITTPLIVMDGAAIYDANENHYLSVETLDPGDADGICNRLSAMGVSFFIYTIHNDKTCIFHSGAVTEAEKVVYERMRRSPYRSYLEGEIYDDSEIVYIKVISDKTRLNEIMHALHSVMPNKRLRRIIRPQQGGENLYALYIYAHTATMEQAQKRLLELLRAEEPGLQSLVLTPRSPYRSERDALALLQRIENAYEPPLLFPRREKTV